MPLAQQEKDAYQHYRDGHCQPLLTPNRLRWAFISIPMSLLNKYIRTHFILYSFGLSKRYTNCLGHGREY